MVILELAGRDYSNRGCFINLRDSNGQTALHLAAFNGHVAAVETMLKHGADTTVRDHSGKTPADKASEMGNGATISVLAGNHRARTPALSRNAPKIN
jgi:ankyrin repeat protein